MLWLIGPCPWPLIRVHSEPLVIWNLIFHDSLEYREDELWEVQDAVISGARSTITIVFPHEQKTLFELVMLFLRQHRGGVRAYGRRRGHIQGVSHPSQEPEDPGCGGGHHPPQPRHQARDLVRSDHQLLDRCFRPQGCKRSWDGAWGGGGGDLIFVFRV